MSILSQPENAIDENGRFWGYASVFDVSDEGGDVVRRGAFNASLKSRPASKIRMLYHHDPKTVIGVWEDIFEDNIGLRVCGRLLNQIGQARDIGHLVKARALDGLSIGFKAKSATKAKSANVRELWQIDLWEISLVSFPMLHVARINPVSLTATPKTNQNESLARMFAQARTVFNT